MKKICLMFMLIVFLLSCSSAKTKSGRCQVKNDNATKQLISEIKEFPTNIDYNLILNKTNSIKSLITKCAGVNAQDENGTYILQYAVQWLSGYSVVRALVDAGADVNVTNNSVSVLHYFAIGSFGDLKTLKYLIDNGVDIDAKDTNGTGIIHYLVQRRGGIFVNTSITSTSKEREDLYELYKKSTIEILDYLIKEKGLDINSQTTTGDTALNFALYNKQKEYNQVSLMLIKEMMKLGANPKIKNSSGKTSCDIVNTLLSVGSMDKQTASFEISAMNNCV